MMSGIRSRDTKPEIVVRSLLHRAGFRFRLHVSGMPGKPDLVLPRYRAAIFVNGCFWHGHGCRLFKWPATREDFWREKIGRNVERDRKAVSKLVAEGWRCLTIWECAIRSDADDPAFLSSIVDWIRNGESVLEIGERS